MRVIGLAVALDVELSIAEEFMGSANLGGCIDIVDSVSAALVLDHFKHSRDGHVSEDIVELAVPTDEGIAFFDRFGRSLRSLAVLYLLLGEESVVPVLEANEVLTRRGREDCFVGSVRSSSYDSRIPVVEGINILLGSRFSLILDSLISGRHLAV